MYELSIVNKMEEKAKELAIKSGKTESVSFPLFSLSLFYTECLVCRYHPKRDKTTYLLVRKPTLLYKALSLGEAKTTTEILGQ